MKGLHKFPIMAVILSAVLVVSGCVVYPANTDAGYGPASRAPAHGYRAKHQYRYYPEKSVYYESARRLYFYLKGENWEIGASLR